MKGAVKMLLPNIRDGRLMGGIVVTGGRMSSSTGDGAAAIAVLLRFGMRISAAVEVTGKDACLAT